MLVVKYLCVASFRSNYSGIRVETLLQFSWKIVISLLKKKVASTKALWMKLAWDSI